MVPDGLFGLAERVAVTAGARAVDKDEGGWEFAKRMLPLVPLTWASFAALEALRYPKAHASGAWESHPSKTAKGGAASHFFWRQRTGFRLSGCQLFPVVENILNTWRDELDFD
jgi:hypothetical protein